LLEHHKRRVPALSHRINTIQHGEMAERSKAPA
jgi:hypothetical protein